MSDRDPIAASLGDDCIVVVVRKADVAHLSRVDSIFMGIDPTTGGNRYLSLVEILTGASGGIFAVHADELVTLDELGRWLAPAAPEREEEEAEGGRSIDDPPLEGAGWKEVAGTDTGRHSNGGNHADPDAIP